MPKVNAPMWNGRKIAKEEDAHDLEQRSALYEFKHRMARADAEHRAHHEYTKDKHREAAAYHLQGLKAAQASGSQEEGHKHGLLYQLHMKKLGLDPMDAVPHEIQSLADKQEKFYKFKPHRGDVFLLQGDDEGEVKKSELEKGDVIKFPGNPAPAVDQGKDAGVRNLYAPPSCEACSHSARNHLLNNTNLDEVIGPKSAAVFREKFKGTNDRDTASERHRMLTTLMHVRHSFQKK